MKRDSSVKFLDPESNQWAKNGQRPNQRLALLTTSHYWTSLLTGEADNYDVVRGSKRGRGAFVRGGQRTPNLLLLTVLLAVPYIVLGGIEFAI
jgi:hypothetical protein